MCTVKQPDQPAHRLSMLRGPLRLYNQQPPLPNWNGALSAGPLMGMWWQWSCCLRPGGGVPALTCPPLQSPLPPTRMQKKKMQTSLRGGTLRRWVAADATFGDHQPRPWLSQGWLPRALVAALGLRGRTLRRVGASQAAARGTPGMLTHSILDSFPLSSSLTCHHCSYRARPFHKTFRSCGPCHCFHVKASGLSHFAMSPACST